MRQPDPKLTEDNKNLLLYFFLPPVDFGELHNHRLQILNRKEVVNNI